MGAMVTREESRRRLRARDWDWVNQFVTRAGGFVFPVSAGVQQTIRSADGAVWARVWQSTPGCMHWEVKSECGESRGRGPLGMAVPEMLLEMNRLRYRYLAIAGVEDAPDVL